VIKHLLFDLDNTLYSSKYNLEGEVGQRLEDYVAKFLNITLQESEEIHRSVIREMGYGTTLEWLMTEKGFKDIEDYYATIYPEDESAALQPDPALGSFLASIPLPKAILTNSNREHTDHILKKLGIAKQFDHIFDIRFNNFRGKPHKEAFFSALDVMKAEPSSTLFIDDYPEFIAGFQRIGGNGLLMDETGRFSDLPYDRIGSLYEITGYLY